MYTGYERLANAIILQAVDDYRKARKDLKLNIHNHEAMPVPLSFSLNCSKVRASPPKVSCKNSFIVNIPPVSDF